MTTHIAVYDTFHSIKFYDINVFILKIAIETLICIRVPLIVIGVTAVIIIIIYRTYKWRRDRDDY